MPPAPDALPGPLRRKKVTPETDLRRILLPVDEWMEDRWTDALEDVEPWYARYPGVFFECALLVAALYPPPAPVRYDPEPEVAVIPLHFVPRLGFPVAYSMRNYYNLQPATMAAYALKNLKHEHLWTFRRVRHGIADLVDLAYTEFVEASPCRPRSRR